MVLAWSLCAALTYGVADYCGGRATKVSSSTAVTFLGQLVALVLLCLLIAVGGVPVMQLHDWVWSGLAGICGAIALIAFYKAMSSNSMTIVAPISAIVALCTPVLVGIGQGERPPEVAFVGIALAAVAVALVGDVLNKHDLTTPLWAVVLAFVSGAGFGLIMVCLAQTSADAGMWPLLGQRVVSVPFIGLIGLVGTGRLQVSRRVLPFAIVSGVLDTAANGFYLLAVRGGMLSLVGVITALYPVSTVGLAIALDKEKQHTSQVIGLILAAVSLAIVGYASNV